MTKKRKGKEILHPRKEKSISNTDMKVLEPKVS
jgi:hypothetical protein